MGKIQVKIKSPFGEIIVEGESAQEILETLETLPPQFMEKIDDLISTKLVSPMKTQLEGVIELTTQGPVITTREKLTHYEAIGLILYASEKKKSAPPLKSADCSVQVELSPWYRRVSTK